MESAKEEKKEQIMQQEEEIYGEVNIWGKHYKGRVC